MLFLTENFLCDLLHVTGPNNNYVTPLSHMLIWYSDLHTHGSTCMATQVVCLCYLWVLGLWLRDAVRPGLC